MWEIPRVIVNKMLSHAQRSLPQECVGLLSGVKREIMLCHPIKNQLCSPSRFLADPTEQIRVFKRLRQENLEMVAIYHSHPTTSAEPSSEDLRQSYYPNVLNLIISLKTDGCLEMNGYLFLDGKAIRQEVTIRD